jgi:hypothetical protein
LVRHAGASFWNIDLEPGGTQTWSGLMSKIEKFLKQRSNARSRGVPFNLTFQQWWDIWEESGKYKDRGRGRRGFVMHRINDRRPYEVGNAEIISAVDNFRETMEAHYIGDRNYV